MLPITRLLSSKDSANFKQILSLTAKLLSKQSSVNSQLTLRSGVKFRVRGALSGLTQFLASESPLKMMKKAFLVLNVFKFLS